MAHQAGWAGGEDLEVAQGGCNQTHGRCEGVQGTQRKQNLLEHIWRAVRRNTLGMFANTHTDNYTHTQITTHTHR